MSVQLWTGYEQSLWSVSKRTNGSHSVETRETDSTRRLPTRVSSRDRDTSRAKSMRRKGLRSFSIHRCAVDNAEEICCALAYVLIVFLLVCRWLITRNLLAVSSANSADHFLSSSLLLPLAPPAEQEAPPMAPFERSTKPYSVRRTPSTRNRGSNGLILQRPADGAWQHDLHEKAAPAPHKLPTSNQVQDENNRIMVTNLHYELTPKDLMVCRGLSFTECYSPPFSLCLVTSARLYASL